MVAVKEKIAPRKKADFEFLRGACECAAEVIVRVGVLSRKSRTAAAQDDGDLWSRHPTKEQFLSDPFIGDAPIGLWKAFQNPQPVQPTGIDFGHGSGRRRARHVAVCGRWQRQMWRLRKARWSAQDALGRFQKGGALGSQSGAGMQHLHPRRVAAPVASLRFPVGAAGQAAQMTPIGAGRVAAVEVGQLLADPAGDRGFHGCGTDLHPSLEIAGTGSEHHTRFVTSGSHGLQDGRVGAIQIDENVAGIAILRVGMDVHVAAFAIANAQESDRGGMGKLGGSPQPLSGECASGRGVNQTNEIEIVRHARELAANGLHGEIESAVEHGPNFGIERTGRTIFSQRTANSGLTGCLSLGVHRKLLNNGLAFRVEQSDRCP